MALTKMIRDGLFADVHPNEVANYAAAGWSTELPKAAKEADAYKSAETGKFVSEEEAKASPKTTYKTKRKKA